MTNSLVQTPMSWLGGVCVCVCVCVCVRERGEKGGKAGGGKSGGGDKTDRHRETAGRKMKTTETTESGLLPFSLICYL